MGKALQLPMQQYLPQREVQGVGLLVQAPDLTNSDMLKIATVVQQIMTELSEALSGKNKIMVITKIVPNETKWLLDFIGCSES
jgi:hypothetical protein